MKKDDQKLIIGLAAVAVGYFGIIRPILRKVGIQRSASEQQQEQSVQQILTAPNKANPFSPVFYQTKEAQTARAILLRVADATILADRIYNALGYFYDDEAAAIAVFRTLKTQSQVSFLSDIFQRKYKTDLAIIEGFISKTIGRKRFIKEKDLFKAIKEYSSPFALRERPIIIK